MRKFIVVVSTIIIFITLIAISTTSNNARAQTDAENQNLRELINSLNERVEALEKLNIESQIAELKTQVTTLKTQLNLGTNFIISEYNSCPPGWDFLGIIGIIASNSNLEKIKPFISTGAVFPTFPEWTFIHPSLCKKL